MAWVQIVSDAGSLCLKGFGERSMRAVLNGVATSVLLAAVVGCAEPRRPAVSARPAKPVVATVVLRVPGMT